jgi:uncharacterized OB-fold protein
MTALTPRHPSLYRLAPDGSIELLFGRCRACDRLGFPANTPGCGHCGAPAEALETVARSGMARLLSCITVHQTLSPALPAPYVVGDLEIAPGVIEEAVLVGNDEPPPGSTMQAVAVPNGERFDCRFAVVPANGPGASCGEAMA